MLYATDKTKDLSDFDMDKIVKAKRRSQSISKTAQLLMGLYTVKVTSY